MTNTSITLRFAKDFMFELTETETEEWQQNPSQAKANWIPAPR